MKTQCPFIYANFNCNETISKTKPFDLRIDCYEDKCPMTMWEPLRCINPAAQEDQKRYLGGHCRVIINICENCKDLHKCKKTGDNKDACRQEEIDTIFRVPAAPQPTTPSQKADPAPKPVMKTMGGASGQEVTSLKDSLSKDIPTFPGKV